MSEQSSVQEEAEKPAYEAAAAESAQVSSRLSKCCGAEHYAKGLCRNHYNQQWYQIRKQYSSAFVNWENIFQKVWNEVNRLG